MPLPMVLVILRNEVNSQRLNFLALSIAVAITCLASWIGSLLIQLQILLDAAFKPLQLSVFQVSALSSGSVNISWCLLISQVRTFTVAAIVPSVCTSLGLCSPIGAVL